MTPAAANVDTEHPPSLRPEEMLAGYLLACGSSLTQPPPLDTCERSLCWAEARRLGFMCEGGRLTPSGVRFVEAVYAMSEAVNPGRLHRGGG